MNWTPESELQLRQLASEGKSRRQIALAIGSSESAVRRKITHLGIEKTSPTGKPWTEKDLEILTRMWVPNPTRVIAGMLGRSYEAVAKKACELGLSRKPTGGMKIRLMGQAVIKNKAYAKRFAAAKGPKETVEEALARGVQVTICPPQHVAESFANRVWPRKFV